MRKKIVACALAFLAFWAVSAWLGEWVDFFRHPGSGGGDAP